MSIIKNLPQVAANNGLVINNQQVTVNITIPTGYSAMSTGIMTVNAGVVVTIPAGSRWVVL
jgi:hypothetical protein